MNATPTGKDLKNPLRIQLLGEFAVWMAGVRIPDAQWKSRRARSLVKLLALAPGGRLHRDQVIEALWPDSDLTAANNNFHQTLYAARKILEAVGGVSLALEEGFLSLSCSDGHDLSVDVEQFVEAASKARGSQTPQAYQDALDLYTGDLLPEDPYEEWVVQRREVLKQVYLNLLLDLARLQEARRDYPAAIDALKRLLAADRSHEEAHTGLMRLYALSGQRQPALRQYQALREALRAELEAEPGPATNDLYQAIQSGRFVPASSPGLFHDKTTPRHNLPAQLTSFIGREAQIGEVRLLVRDQRLVTLTGSGGTGKTRLALKAAEGLLEDFTDGVFLVELAPLSDPELVPQACFQALRLIEQPGATPQDLLVHYLGKKDLLLILDNCEHLIVACTHLVNALLKACPSLHILATSREVLSVPGETRFRVPSLEVPDAHALPPLDEMAQVESVRLFLDRAVRITPAAALTPANASAFAQVAQRLDGIPLALELAAARVSMMTVEQVAARLDDVFHLLTGGNRAALPRHQTLKAMIDWSYDLLSPKERLLLQHLSVFAGGWTLEAAEAICADEIDGSTRLEEQLASFEVLDQLAQLVDKSLVIVEPGVSETRYHMLETIRQYARDRLLEAGGDEQVRDRHLAYFIHAADRAMLKPFQNIWGRQWSLLKNDLENIRAALGWSLSGPLSPRIEEGLRLAGTLGDFWFMGCLNTEGRAWLSKALAWTTDRGPDLDAFRARAFDAAGNLAVLQGDTTEAERLLKEGIALCRKMGDEWLLVCLLIDLGLWTYPINLHGSQQAIAEAVALGRQVGDPVILALALMWQGHIDKDAGNHESAAQHFQESLDLMRKNGIRGGACYPLVGLGDLAFIRGEIEAALRYREEYLECLPDIDDRSLTYYASYFMLESAYHQENFKEMESLILEIKDLSPQFSLDAVEYWQRLLGITLKRQGRYLQAASLFFENIQLAIKRESWPIVYTNLAQLAGMIARLRQPARAARLFGAVDAFFMRSQKTMGRIERCDYDRDVAAARDMLSEGDYSQAWAEGRLLTLEEAVRKVRAIAEELGLLAAGK